MQKRICEEYALQESQRRGKVVILTNPRLARSVACDTLFCSKNVVDKLNILYIMIYI